MKFLRKIDFLAQSLATSQARIFERSVEGGFSSATFVRSFLLSDEAKLIDDLDIDVPGLTEDEIYESVTYRIKNSKGHSYPYQVMYFIGYFYRMAAYLTGYTSKQLYQNIKPALLYRNFNVLHSIAIEEAINEVFQMANIKTEDKYELFRKYYEFKRNN